MSISVRIQRPLQVRSVDLYNELIEQEWILRDIYITPDDRDDDFYKIYIKGQVAKKDGKPKYFMLAVLHADVILDLLGNDVYQELSKLKPRELALVSICALWMGIQKKE